MPARRYGGTWRPLGLRRRGGRSGRRSCDQRSTRRCNAVAEGSRREDFLRRLAIPPGTKGDSRMHYHDTDDLKRMKDLGKAAPEEFKAWLALDRIVAREDGQIPR